ncbi:TnsD family Tn7-like transposition protein [Paraglaciecola chathamensis]|uniref:Transposon Tn7 transposition protein TnsD C-termianl domain-containing protein n=1 Tax=Paraglaciecola chathamensis S18K6 TaxID=1127672 RepID=A0AAV3UTC4_9ALTE|nr:TnsD family Tn7-like transposition protein [Paraglaciecola chathamensis]GAC08259.1 hypothetical protein GCHA_0294 [Paraglaciecola chathamensis S18K6]
MRLPSGYPDESFYSRIIRSITLTGKPVEQFLYENFNKNRVSIHPYLNAGIRFTSNLSLSDIEHIQQQQTLLKLFVYYLPTRSPAIINAFLQGDCNALLRACNLASFNETEELAVKYCPACAKEDIYEHGVNYWHISHQIPGVESCSKHPVILNRLKLPARVHIAPSFLPPHNMDATHANDTMFAFAKHTKQFIFDELATTECFNLPKLRELLCKTGYMLRSGTIKNKKLTTDLRMLAEELNLPNDVISPLKTAKNNYVYHLLNGKFTQHPFKYLLISFLLDGYSNKRYFPKTVGKKIDHPTSECLDLLRKGMPILQIHRLTGMSRCFIKHLALYNKIEIKRIPRTIDDSVIKQVLNYAYRGFHRNYIAYKTDISVGSVEQIISSEPGLVQKRRRYKFESKRRRNRLEILRCIQRQPKAIKQEIKNQCYSAFHWLYRNDKSWLNSTMPAPLKNKFHWKVDWPERDISLAEKVSAILMSKNDAISLSKIDEEIGSHGWLLKGKKKLPLTMNVINKYMNKE